MTTNQKINCAMRRARVGLFHGDIDLVKASLDVAKALIEKGGDWDKRNRYTVYEGLYCELDSRAGQRSASRASV